MRLQRTPVVVAVQAAEKKAGPIGTGLFVDHITQRARLPNANARSDGRPEGYQARRRGERDDR